MSDQVMEKLMELSETQREMLANQNHQQKSLDKHSDLLEKQAEILLRNTLTVERHERRSTLLEAEVSKIQSHVNNVKTVGKLAKWFGIFTAGLVSALASIYEIMSYRGK